MLGRCPGEWNDRLDGWDECEVAFEFPFTQTRLVVDPKPQRCDPREDLPRLRMGVDCVTASMEGPSRMLIPFLACGDLSGYDADQSYPLEGVEGGGYVVLDPVQPPIAPPYKTAKALEKLSIEGGV